MSAKAAKSSSPESSGLEHRLPPTDVFAPAPGQNTRFRPMLQGQGTNRLTSISTRKPPRVDPVTGLATINDGQGFTVFIEEYNKLAGGGLRVSTHKLLDLCAIILTQQNPYRGGGQLNTQIAISLEEYMRQCRIPLTKPSKDKTRSRVKADLEALYNTSIEWTEAKGGQTADYAKMRLITAQGIKNGQILVNFSPQIARYLTQAYIMQYPLALLAVSEKNPNAYAIGKKLLLHSSMESNQRKGTAGIISIKKILAAAPDIPTPEEVMKSGRQLVQRIKAPFEKAMNALSEIISEWEYCNQKGRPIADKSKFGFDDFMASYLTFTVANAPESRLKLPRPKSGGSGGDAEKPTT